MTEKEPRYGVRYPNSGIHECPFGLEQAQTIQYLATINGVNNPTIVQNDGTGWQPND